MLSQRPDHALPALCGVVLVQLELALDPDERYANTSELLAALGSLQLGLRPLVWRLARPVLGLGGILIGSPLLLCGELQGAAWRINVPPTIERIVVWKSFLRVEKPGYGGTTE